jgi:hypothetical protein
MNLSKEAGVLAAPPAHTEQDVTTQNTSRESQR